MHRTSNKEISRLEPMVADDKTGEAVGRAIGENGPVLDFGAVPKCMVIHALYQFIWNYAVRKVSSIGLDSTNWSTEHTSRRVSSVWCSMRCR